MNNTIIKITVGIIIAMLSSSCDKFLGTVPKGEKIPTTFEDYNAFMRYYENHYHDNMQQLCLLNDIYRSKSALNSYELARINYMWDESADRKIQDNNVNYSSNSTIYSYCYQGIAHWNLIIEDANKLTECTEQQRAQLKAQAKVLRAMDYFHLTNYFADQYTAGNAKTALTVPLVESANIESSSPQVTQEKMYEFILSNLTEESIEQLPDKGETVFHPTKGAGYGMLARVSLQMGNYENALKYAQKALDINGSLYDWRPYYIENKAQYENNEYATSYPAVVLNSPENYVFAFSGQLSYQTGTQNIPVDRAAAFDQKDLRLRTRWKFYPDQAGDYYKAIRRDYFNAGGISTPEMYYIKAECLARKNQIQEAMNIVNQIREKRFLEEDYTPLNASSISEAIGHIIQEKANEYLQSSIPFWDMRRLNKDSQYAHNLTKTADGQTYTLKPDSHLWIMPFPEKVMTNPGNGTITQNTPL